jgi:hypothetical protein
MKSTPSLRALYFFRIMISIILLITLLVSSSTIAHFSLATILIFFNLSYYTIYFKIIFKYWILLGNLLGFINSHILFTLMYFFIFTPIGLFFRIIKRDVFQLKMKRKSYDSYWIKRKDPPSSMKWQY